MLATLGPPPSGRGFGVEFKWDGQHACEVEDGTVAVVSRNGADITRTFPELAGIGDAVGGRPVVLDGEIVSLDDQGLPSFTRLQQR
jgi:bifunctional non-homologous end joining protein LigD